MISQLIIQSQILVWNRISLKLKKALLQQKLNWKNNWKPTGSKKLFHHQEITKLQTLELIQISKQLKPVLKELNWQQEKLLLQITVKILEVIQLTTVFQALELIQKLQQVKPVLLRLKSKWNTRLRWEPTKKLWLNGVKSDTKPDQFQILV